MRSKPEPRIIKFLRSQEIGYALLQAEQQRLQAELQAFALQVLKDNGADMSAQWTFDDKALLFTEARKAP